MKHTNIKKMTITALLIAIAYIATSFIKVPIPFGYVNLGFSILLISVFFFGTRTGLFAGAIGSALSDLLSPYAIWTLPTFFIKCMIALVIGAILFRNKSEKNLFGGRTMVAVTVGSLIHIVLYTVATWILGGNLKAALVAAPLLGLECIVNVIAFFALASILGKTKIADFQKD